MLGKILDLIQPIDNVIYTSRAMARQLKLPVTRTTISRFLESHPDHDSLLSIRDFFENYGLRVSAMRVKAEKLPDVPLPFITQVTQPGLEGLFFTAVRNADGSFVRYLHPVNGRWIRVAAADFLARWSGVVLITSPKKDIFPGDSQYPSKRRKELGLEIAQVLAITGMPVLFALIAASATGFHQKMKLAIAILYVALALTGAFISSLLVVQKWGGGSALFQAYCKGKSTDCNAVLQSRGSRLLGIELSTIGFVYFWGMVTGLLMNGILEPAALFISGWMSLAALPFTIYALLYQWLVLGRWCRFCLGVQGVLILQGVIVLNGEWLFTGLGYGWSVAVLRLALGFFIAFAVSTLVFPLAAQIGSGREAIKRITKIKRSPDVFRIMMAAQETLIREELELGLLLGNRAAQHTLVKVCNPFCKHCSAAHATIRELLGKGVDIKIRIIFTGLHESEPVRLFLRLAEESDARLVHSAMDSWYSDKKEYRNLLGQYMQPDTRFTLHGESIEAMRTWCKKMDISATPTYFLDGKRLPGLYAIPDLEWLIPRGNIQ